MRRADVLARGLRRRICCLCFPETTLEDAIMIAGRLRKISSLTLSVLEMISKLVSIFGWCVKTKFRQYNSHSLIKEADIALYRAKAKRTQPKLLVLTFRLSRSTNYKKDALIASFFV